MSILDPYGLMEIEAGTPNWHTIYNNNLAKLNDAIAASSATYVSIPNTPPISMGQPCHIVGGSGYLISTDCRYAAQMPAHGIALNAATAGEDCTIRMFGIVSCVDLGISLTQDKDYYIGRLAQLVEASDAYVIAAAGGYVQYFGRTFRVSGVVYLFINPTLYALGVDETDTNALKLRMVSNNLAKGWVTKVDYRRASQSFLMKNVPATTTAAVYLINDADFPEFVAPWAGTIVGVSARANAAVSAGTCTVKGTVDGVTKTVNAVLDSTHQSAYGTGSLTTDTFAAGARLGMTFTSDGSWAPTTLDVVCTLWIAYTA